VSLTLEIRDKQSPTRLFIDREFPHLGQLSREINKSLRRFDGLQYPKHPDLYTYSVIGTAIDYRIRCFFTDAPFVAWPIQHGLQKFKYVWKIETPERVVVNRFWGKPAVKLKSEFNARSKALLKQLHPLRRLPRGRTEERLCRY
jgi:hypothetical protein